MSAVLACAAYLLLAYIEAPGLVRRKLWGELAAFAVLDALAATLSVLYALHVRLPDVVKGMQWLFEDLLHLKY